MTKFDEWWERQIYYIECDPSDYARAGWNAALDEAANVCFDSKNRWANMEGEYSHSDDGCYECGREDQCLVLGKSILALKEK